MPPRKTTDVGALFEALIEDLRIQLATSIDHTLTDITKRLGRLERRLDQLDPKNAHAALPEQSRRLCSLCERKAVARGLCSAHYQQWRYRERKSNKDKMISEQNDALQTAILLAQNRDDQLTKN